MHMALLTKAFQHVNHFIARNMGSVFGTIDVEMPAYSVTQKTDSYEVREYPEGKQTENASLFFLKFILSKMLVFSGVAIECNTYGSSGFGRLARYIGVGSTPLNEESVPVAMTAPVVSKKKSVAVAMTAPVVSKVSEAGDVMQFILPKEL